jgi:hypothetical protein
MKCGHGWITGTADIDALEGAAWQSESDPEYESRLDAARVTAEFATKSQRPLDAGKKSILDSPIFGGERQKGLFE